MFGFKRDHLVNQLRASGAVQGLLVLQPSEMFLKTTEVPLRNRNLLDDMPGAIWRDTGGHVRYCAIL